MAAVQPVEQAVLAAASVALAIWATCSEISRRRRLWRLWQRPGKDPNGPIRGEHREAQVTISFMEAVKGCTRNIKVSRLENCSECGGSGAARKIHPGRSVPIATAPAGDCAASDRHRRNADAAALRPLRRTGAHHQGALPQVRRQGPCQGQQDRDRGSSLPALMTAARP